MKASTAYTITKRTFDVIPVSPKSELALYRATQNVILKEGRKERDTISSRSREGFILKSDVHQARHEFLVNGLLRNTHHSIQDPIRDAQMCCVFGAIIKEDAFADFLNIPLQGQYNLIMQRTSGYIDETPYTSFKASKKVMSRFVAMKNFGALVFRVSDATGLVNALGEPLATN